MKKIKEIVRIKQEVKRGVGKYDTFIIKSPEDAKDLITGIIGDEDREVLLVVVLNSKNMVNAVHRAHIGSLNASIVHPREVFKAAIINNGCSIIMAHNHPSYNCQPSKEDIDITKRIKKAGEILGIELLDHLIVSETSYTSLKAKGYL